MRDYFPEGGFTKEIDSKIDKEVLIEQGYKKAEFLNRKYSIKEENFKDMYGNDVVDDDLIEVARREQLIFQEADENTIENNKLSEIFNAIILEQFEKNNWMGQNAFTIGTSKHDKFETGISNITEFHEEKGISYLAMAIKVTFSSNLKEKLLKIKENIKNGELSKIKYFESDLHRGELKKVPNVIVGCSKEMLFEVIELWLQNNNKALSEHPLQFLVLDQEEEEISCFKDAATSYGNYELVEIYERVLNNVNEILKEKNDLRKKLEKPKEGNSLSFMERNDKVMISLKQELENVFER